MFPSGSLFLPLSVCHTLTGTLQQQTLYPRFMTYKPVMSQTCDKIMNVFASISVGSSDSSYSGNKITVACWSTCFAGAHCCTMCLTFKATVANTKITLHHMLCLQCSEFNSFLKRSPKDRCCCVLLHTSLSCSVASIPLEVTINPSQAPVIISGWSQKK